MSKHKASPETEAAEPEGVSAKVAGAYSAALAKATDASREAASGIEASPFSALLGGLALGAAAGVLIARSEREKAMLAPLGERINEAARAAIDAGRAAGHEALADAGLDLDTLRGQAAKLFGQATGAAGAVGVAALKGAREATKE